MIKQILFVALCISASQQAALAACGSTNGYTVNGVCQYHDDQLCKTWDATGCSACIDAADTQNATTKRCSCASTKNPIVASGAKSCADKATGQTCVDGFILGATPFPCDACHASCKTCNAKDDAAKCVTCFDGSTGGGSSGAACNKDTGMDKLIPGVGFVATCPVGYVEDTTVSTLHKCQRCLYGCATCALADKDTKCLTCAVGHLLNTTTNRCEAATATGTGACATGCKAQKCQTTAANCTECDTGYVFTAAGVCSRNSIELCKKYNATDATLCDECETDAEASADKKSCKCKSHLKKNITAYKAATTTPVAAAVFYAQKCEACGVTCAAGSTCTVGTAPAADTCAAGSAAPVSNISVTCTDSALVAANCATCGTDGKCTACLNTTLLATDCTKCAADHVKKTATECVPVGTCKAADCTNGKVCGWSATNSKVECIDPPAETTAAATNGLLLSAISMIAALILA